MAVPAQPLADCDDTDAAVAPGRAEVCDGHDTDCDGAVPADEADADGDDWTVCGGDCDDADAARNPGAAEVCDAAETDEDCDGAADDRDADVTETTTWHPDDDGDGYGDPELYEDACVAPEGYVADGTDCDDDDAARSPASTWYTDADGDGYGVEGDARTQCEPPEGYAAAGGDCDDADADVSPGAADVCVDGVDNDCDGEVDRCAVGDADAIFEGTASSQSAGQCAFSEDLDGDGLPDVLVGAPGDATGASFAGAAFALAGTTRETTTLASSLASFIGENEQDGLRTVAGPGDMDGDGYADVVVGAAGFDGGESSVGAVYVFFGPHTGARAGADADARLLGEASGDQAGFALASGGDLTGDGLPDVIVGARGYSTGRPGRVYVVADPAAGATSLSSATATLTGESADDSAGYSVAGGGDLDGDGVADLVIGAPRWERGCCGNAYVVLGPVSGSVSLGSADGKLTGTLEYDGQTVAIVRDTDGDGADDLLVGRQADSTAYTYAGAAVLFAGAKTGALTPSAADATFLGATEREQAGHTVANGGDLDGDGLGDVLIGAPYRDGAYASNGVAYAVLGPFSGTLALGDADVIVDGPANSGAELARIGLAGGADVDGDGFDDLLVGSHKADVAAGREAGAVYLFLGGPR